MPMLWELILEIIPEDLASERVSVPNVLHLVLGNGVISDV